MIHRRRFGGVPRRATTFKGLKPVPSRISPQHRRSDAAHLSKDDMPSTQFDERRGAPRVGHSASPANRDLQQQFESIVVAEDIRWTVRYRLLDRLGSGSQGVVFLAERMGAHNISLPVALKVFSPTSYSDTRAYRRGMERVARVGMHLALIQQDHLLDMHNVIQCRGISVQVMEWVDGFDLRHLLLPESLQKVRSRLSPERFDYINDVIITAGPKHSRLKPGVAIAVVRECLAALGAMHRQNIVHADVKLANIMLKRTGNTKLIDFGFAFELGDKSAPRACTPRYAAVEVLMGEESSPVSDLASLGYCLVEMLSGRTLFAGLEHFNDLIRAKRELMDQLPDLLPPDICRDDRLLALIRGLIAPDPANRFPNAEAADFRDEGAANFQRELVKGDLSAEYENEIRLWLQEVE